MNPDEYLLLSGIQHYFFCKRQWALIHIEQYWKENALTTEGRFLHEKVDQPYLKERRRGIIYSRSIPVISHLLRFRGVLDMVEFHQGKKGIVLNNEKGLWDPIIVEYKKGKPKEDICDHMQLTAEVIALEETLHTSIDHAFLYYNEVRRRQKVLITLEMREKVIDASREMMNHFILGNTFNAEPSKNCNRCSLKDYCLPRLTKKRKNVGRYLRENILCEN